ncbi:MAG: hypothetical protein SA339_06505 [Methanomassiliicoccus sp.]|nr:hypothetical protein [Methanomassiliicoccus sp.]
MGMSVSIATAIIFIASLISFASLAGALDQAQSSLIEAQKASASRDVEALHTSISLTEIDRPNGTIEVVNSGEVTLSLDELDIFINGTLSNERITSMTVQGHNDTKLWLSGEVLVIDLNGELSGAAIKIVTANGTSVYD